MGAFTEPLLWAVVCPNGVPSRTHFPTHKTNADFRKDRRLRIGRPRKTAKHFFVGLPSKEVLVPRMPTALAQVHLWRLQPFPPEDAPILSVPWLLR